MAESLFTNQVPTLVDEFDGGANQTGTTLLFAVDGEVSGIRFRAPATVAVDHTFTARLYQVDTDDDPLETGTGTLITGAEASVSGASVTASAWNVISFPASVDVDTAHAYRAVIHNSAGRYVATGAFFNIAPLVNGNITGIRDLSSPNPPGIGTLRNGCFKTGAVTYPNNSFNGNCYFVDVVYVADTAIIGALAATLPAIAVAATGDAEAEAVLAATLPALQAFLTDVKDPLPGVLTPSGTSPGLVAGGTAAALTAAGLP